MGKGDRKSRKGKIFKGSYGVVRPKKSAVEVFIPTKKKVAKEVVEEKPKAEKKKATPKKTAVAKKKAPVKKKATAKKK